MSMVQNRWYSEKNFIASWMCLSVNFSFETFKWRLSVPCCLNCCHLHIIWLTQPVLQYTPCCFPALLLQEFCRCLVSDIVWYLESFEIKILTLAQLKLPFMTVYVITLTTKQNCFPWLTSDVSGSRWGNFCNVDIGRASGI